MGPEFALTKLVRSLHQGAQIPRLHNRMARVRRDVQFGFGPGTMKVPRTRHRTHNVITSLNNQPGNMSNLPDIFNEVIVSRKEAIVHEVMTLDAGERFGE